MNTIPSLAYISELPASQQPAWPALEHLEVVVKELESRNPLVAAERCEELTTHLGEVASGNAFLLHGGDCAETLDYRPEEVEHLVRVLLSMTVTLMCSGIKVVKVARMAGQFAKPRSSELEERDGIVLPSYRGDIVNGLEFSAEARRPDPIRMLTAYDLAAIKLEQLSELTNGDFANLEHVNQWNLNLANDSGNRQYQYITRKTQDHIAFMKAAGGDIESVRHADIYTSHEALLLPYELALTRPRKDGKLYDSSAHMLWIGKRTNQLDSAHVAYCEVIENPIGIKVGPNASPEEILNLCEKLNPRRIPGRLNLIVRMGAGVVEKVLPPLLKTVQKSGYPVVWSSDPMHENTYTIDGVKTRDFDSIANEFDEFADACEALDVWPGGAHIEFTGEDVTECMGGSDPRSVTDLDDRYETACDPRLNGQQAMELAMRITGRVAKL